MILYHGTNSDALDQIMTKGITPRGQRKSLWEAYPSARDRVYLTDAYAIYFACCAAKDGQQGVILQVDVNPRRLVADEDALAQAKCTDLSVLNGMNLQQKTAWWRKNAPKYPGLASDSLRLLGNAAHMGTIFPSQIVKVIKFDVTPEIVLSNDPTITIMNYQLLGTEYRNALKLFVETDGKEGRRPAYPYGLRHFNNGEQNGMDTGPRNNEGTERQQGAKEEDSVYPVQRHVCCRRNFGFWLYRNPPSSGAL